MVAIGSIVAVACAIAWLELPRLRRDGRTREIVLFVALLVVASAIAMADSFVEVPTPFAGYSTVLRPLEQAIKAIGLIR